MSQATAIGNASLDVQALPPGLYLLRAYDAAGSSLGSARLLKN